MDYGFLPGKTNHDCGTNKGLGVPYQLARLIIIFIRAFVKTNHISLKENILKWAFLLVAFSVVINSSAQLPHYPLSRVTEQEGLRTSDLLNIAIDSSDIMWLATQAHVQQFDGRQKLHFPFDETVIKVYVDKKNRKWVITRNHVYRIAANKKSLVKVFTDSSRTSLVETIFEPGDGNLYMIRGNTSLQYDSLKDAFISKSLWKFTVSGAVRYFTQTNQYQILAIVDSVIIADLSGNRIASWLLRGKLGVADAGNGMLFIPCSDFKTRIMRISDGSVSIIKVPEPKKGNPGVDFILLHAVQFEPDKLLLSTNKGLFLWDRQLRQFSIPSFYFNGEPLRNPSLSRYLYKSADGTVYICHADGIFSCNPGQNGIQYLKNIIDNGSGITESDVRSFTEDEKGLVWMATTQGMASVDFTTGDKKIFPPFTGNNPIEYPSYRMLLNDGDYLWIGTAGNGVWALHKPSGRYVRPLPDVGVQDKKELQAIFETTYTWKLVKLQNGKLLVAGGGRSFLLDPDKMTYTRIEKAWAGQSARSAIQDSAGNTWFGSSRGLWWLDPYLNPIGYLKDSFPDERVAALCEWRRNHILAGTKGLYEIVVNNGKAFAFKRIEAIPQERFVYCMVQDKKGMVWLGTDDGIYHYDPYNKKATRFGQEDFIQPQAFNSNGAFVTSGGLILMGGRAGLNYFLPEKINKRNTLLLPFILSFRFGANDSAWTQPAGFRIPYSIREIDFSISAPQYRNPFGIRYRYRLPAKDTNWIDNGNNNRVRIHNLAPGNYTLQVAAAEEGYTWYSSNQMLSFSIAKPWWQTIGFRLSAIALIVAIVLAILKMRRRKREAAEIQKMLQYFALSGNGSGKTIDILWDIARNCIARLGFEDCVIYLLNTDRNVLVQKAAYGEKSPREFEIVDPIEIKMGDGITGYAALHAVSVRVGDTTKDARYITDDEKRLSELAVPILYEGRVIGVIDSEHRNRHFFTQTHQQTLEQIAALCSTKIANGLSREAMLEAEQKLELLHNRFTEAQFTNLRLQMNPHFLFNTLTSIQYLVVSGQTSNATRYLNIFSTFLRDLLQYADLNIVPLAEELRILKNYIALESLTMDESFNYSIEADETIDKEDVLIPFMILQPFVENAIQHGLVHLTGEKKFSIELRNIEDSFLRCLIEDNGIGRQKAKAIQDAKLVAGRYQSKGIDIVRQRLDLLYQRTGKKGSIIYEDLYTNEGNPCGTKVVLEIPYYQNVEL